MANVHVFRQSSVSTLVQRLGRTPLLIAALTWGCGSTQEAAPDTLDEGVCPSGQQECDRLPQPCIAEDPAVPIPHSQVAGITSSKSQAGKYRVWPGGRVPYKIDASLSETTRNRLLSAMAEWAMKTQGQVYFEPAKDQDSPILRVTAGKLPLTSHVGYRASANSKVELRNPEPITVIRHELGHVLGLQHEQKRKDRQDSIQVKVGNIVNTSLCKAQFSVCQDCELLGDYFVESVMHYRTTDLSDCRSGPVLLKQDGSKIDHSWLIRSGDVQAIHQLYGAPPDMGSGGAGGMSGGGAAGAAAGGAAGTSAAGGGGMPSVETGGAGGSSGFGDPTAGGSARDDGLNAPEEPGDSSDDPNLAADSDGAAGGCSATGTFGAGTHSGTLLLGFLGICFWRRRRASLVSYTIG